MNFWYQIGSTFLPQLTWRRNNEAGKVVYLTFDDGPHPTITPWVISELDKVGAKATFFVVGDNARKYDSVMTELIAQNHSIGNHTMHHIKGWSTNALSYLQDIELCAKQIGDTDLFRPPHGQINFKALPQITDNYELIMWDILTKDYNRNLSVRRAQKRIRKATCTGSIVVFHDSAKAEKNLRKLLPDYLQFLQKEGYEMKAL